MIRRFVLSQNSFLYTYIDIAYVILEYVFIMSFHFQNIGKEQHATTQLPLTCLSKKEIPKDIPDN